MKFALLITLFIYCAYAEEAYLFCEPPAIILPSQAAGPEFLKLNQPVDTHAIIRAAAQKHGVPAAFVKSIVAAESNFDPTVVSPKGAVGLMQLMPGTAQQYGANPKIPAENVDAGTQYLKFLIAKYRGSKNWLKRVIAAYNAGPAVVDRYRGVPPYKETKSYVSRVLSYMRQFQRDPSLSVGALRASVQ
jgi:soluble lytic murein transglycosylase-like protein